MVTQPRYQLPNAAARHRALAQLAPDPDTLVGDIVPAPPWPPHVHDIVNGLKMHVRAWEADPRQCHLLYSYRRAGEEASAKRAAAGEAPECVNPCGNLPYFRPFNDVVKTAAKVLRSP